MVSCDNDPPTAFLIERPAPSNIDAVITVGDDRLVSVQPSALNATAFNIFFGESENEEPVLTGVQTTATNMYESDGIFLIQVEAISPNGRTSSVFFNVEVIDVPEIVIPEPINALTFDDGGNASFIFSFGGASANEIVANPFPGGFNPVTNDVLQITNEGAETFDGHGWGLPPELQLDFTGSDKVVSAVVYSEEAIDVRFQVQGGLDGALILRANAAHSGSGWEALVFDFNTAEISSDGGQANAGDIVAADGVYAESIITLGPDVQSPGIFYIDNIGLLVEE